jgi:2-methylisocitrate lyase-like PEP mutase family enzyme
MRVGQIQKGERFRALHAGPGAFVIPNPWDAGTARIMTRLGFEALTTTSGGLAFTLGKRDGAPTVTREETLANAKAMVDATDLPVAGDLENGFGDAPEAVAATIRLAGETAGLVGGSIEDSSGNPQRPLYGLQQAVERMAAAAEAARALPFPFVLVGGRRTTCTAAATWTIPSAGSKPSRPPGPTPSTRRGSRDPRTFARCVPR